MATARNVVKCTHIYKTIPKLSVSNSFLGVMMGTVRGSKREREQVASVMRIGLGTGKLVVQ